MDADKIGGELGGFRKLIQDLVAPELGAIKATQAAHGEQFILIRAEMAKGFEAHNQNQRELRADMKEGFASVRVEIKEAEQRNARLIEANSNELKALIKAQNAERRAEEAERDRDLFRKRIEELESGKAAQR